MTKVMSPQPKPVAFKPAPSNGWGDHYNWTTLKDGLVQAKRENKPIMLIVSNDKCRVCQQLKKVVKDSPEIEALANNFIMVNVAQSDLEYGDRKYGPDGEYNPRIIFLKPSGETMTEVVNHPDSKKYKYTYDKASNIAANMKKVRERIALATM